MKPGCSEPKRQICQAISIAIIPYYSKAHPLCYPAIETGSARGNLMTHKVVALLAAESQSECFTPFFHPETENPHQPL